MTMYICFTMRIKPTIAYENIFICYIIIAVNLLRILITFPGYSFYCLCKISLVKPSMKMAKKVVDAVRMLTKIII